VLYRSLRALVPPLIKPARDTRNVEEGCMIEDRRSEVNVLSRLSSI
jgi:hypothetical protein